jgi:hypothetical protein
MEKSYILYVLVSTVLWYKHLITNPHRVYGQCSFTRGICDKVVVETRRTDHHQAYPLEVPEVEWATGTSKELRPRRSEYIITNEVHTQHGPLQSIMNKPTCTHFQPILRVLRIASGRQDIYSYDILLPHFYQSSFFH